MKRLPLLALVATALVAAGALALPAVGAGSTRAVALRDNFFAPKKVTVHRGTTLRFVWRGHLKHNVDVLRGPQKFRSPFRFKGSYIKRVTRPGTYRLVCEVHTGMTMTLTVT
jgi:plastocyanin